MGIPQLFAVALLPWPLLFSIPGHQHTSSMELAQRTLRPLNFPVLEAIGGEVL
jgi:hypothetical protein